MDLGLSGKVALVAGSSRGIGKAIARAFLMEGCRTVITGRQPVPLAETTREFESAFGRDLVMPCEGDLTRADFIRKMIGNIRERWERIDCLVANIGSGKGKGGWALEEADWSGMFETNLWGSLRLVTEALHEMTHAGRGSITFVASIAGVETTPAPLPYCVAKTALISYSKNLSRVVAEYNVRVNCVAPGNILFAGGTWEKHLAERKEEVMRYISTEVPMRRFGRPEEIADLVVFLSSDRAAFITGACVVADGGQTRSL